MRKLLVVALTAWMGWTLVTNLRDSSPELDGLLPGGPEASPSLDPAPEASEPSPTLRMVAYVIDGDTIVLASGETVRLRGIDAPERGECGSVESTRSLTRLVLGERVSLVRAGDDTDRYGRLLRFVDIGEVDAGLRQIKRGLAVARFDSRDGYGAHPREARYVAADRKFSSGTPCRT